jgi:hypothetical protein
LPAWDRLLKMNIVDKPKLGIEIKHLCNSVDFIVDPQDDNDNYIDEDEDYDD